MLKQNISTSLKTMIFKFLHELILHRLSMRIRAEEIHVVFISRQDNEKSLDSILKLSIQISPGFLYTNIYH